MNRIMTCCCCTSDAYDSECLPTATVSSESPRYESRNNKSDAAHLSSDAYDSECHGLPTTYDSLAAPNIVVGLVRRVSIDVTFCLFRSVPLYASQVTVRIIHFCLVTTYATYQRSRILPQSCSSLCT